MNSSCNIQWAKVNGAEEIVRDEIGKVQITAFIKGVPIEDSVWEQVSNLAHVPGVERIAVMPDAHMGNGACVGSAILTRDVVIPAAVGVDIGCGMIAAPLGITVVKLKGLFPQVRAEIEKRVPVGRTDNGGINDRGAWGFVPLDVGAVWANRLYSGYTEMINDYPELEFPNAMRQLGTLGTGNHFIELQYEEALGLESPVWVMLHSGSRGVGNRIGSFFTKQARFAMAQWHHDLPDRELAFLPIDTKLGKDYLKYAAWAQRYAWESRLLMWSAVLDAIWAVVGDIRSTVEPIHISHNYVSHETHFGRGGLVTRKGSIDASLGKLGIIPSNMGNHSFITSGLGNPESLMTSSHGAGRTMSRTAIKKIVTLDEHLAALGDVECRRDADVIDETPSAYKNIDAVMEAQKELTTPVTALKQFIVVKG